MNIRSFVVVFALAICFCASNASAQGVSAVAVIADNSKDGLSVFADAEDFDVYVLANKPVSDHIRIAWALQKAGPAGRFFNGEITRDEIDLPNGWQQGSTASIYKGTVNGNLPSGEYVVAVMIYGSDQWEPLTHRFYVRNTGPDGRFNRHITAAIGQLEDNGKTLFTINGRFSPGQLPFWIGDLNHPESGTSGMADSNGATIQLELPSDSAFLARALTVVVVDSTTQESMMGRFLASSLLSLKSPGPGSGRVQASQ